MVPSVNVYMLQSRGGGYHPIRREVVNILIEKGRAEWIGTDYDEEQDAFVHYADRTDI